MGDIWIAEKMCREQEHMCNIEKRQAQDGIRIMWGPGSMETSADSQGGHGWMADLGETLENKYEQLP